MRFDPEIALSYARALSRPRRVGSGEDEAVAREIAEKLKQFGYRVERQPFEFSTAPGVFITAEILTSQLLILAALRLRESAPWATTTLALFLLLFIYLVGYINRTVGAGSLAARADGVGSRWSALCLRLGTRHHTANLVATLPDASADPRLPAVCLVAHYDSKSQWLPLAARIPLFVVALAGASAFAGLTLLSSVYPVLTALAAAAGITALLAGLPLLLLDAGNASPGAIDNASGLALVLHLAECLLHDPRLRARLRVTVLMTGAEELSVMGAAAYVRENAGRLRHQAEAGGLHVLNFDGVGVRGKLYLAGGGAHPYPPRQQMVDLIRQTCGEMKLPLGTFALPGAMFDHLPFVGNGLDAVTLMAIGRASWAVHTRGDSADKLDVQGFRQAGQVALGVMEKLAG